MQPPEIQYVARPDGVHIAYQVVGDGSVDIVVAPGFVSHLDVLWSDPGYVSFLRRLTRFARIVVFDKAGTGCSDPLPAPATLERRAEDLGLVAGAAGAERPVVLATGDSGPPAIVFAATRPERLRSLVVYGSFARMLRDERSRRFDQALERCLAEWGKGHVADVLAPSAVSRAQRRLWAALERAAAGPGMARALFESIREIDVLDVLPTVRTATLVLHRAGDLLPIERGREIADGIPGALFTELPGSDHAFWVGDVAPLVDAIEAFVTGGNLAAAPERAVATILFTDIVGSTERAAQLGDARWRALIERHDAIVREHVSAAGGRVVKSLGDGSLSVLDGPARAIRCAEALLDRLADEGIVIRAGLHTGECETIGEDVGGMAVHIAARVAAGAAPGELRVSSTVADLVVGSGIAFTPLGEHSLKGVPGRWRLLAVGEPQPGEVPVGPRRGTRVVVAEDTMLTRKGIVTLLESAGVDVVGEAEDADELLQHVRTRRPDVAIVDIRMPPTHTDEGLVAARTIRAEHADTAVLVLSQYVEPSYALRLIQEHPEGVGYLLKERVFDGAILVDALRRITDGETVVDPTLVSRLVGRRRRSDPLDELTDREREVLGLVAEGRSNKAIAEQLFITPRTVEAHTKQIFLKLGIRESPGDHRRVLAVIAFLRS